MLILGIFLIFMYGEFMWIMKAVGVKKKKRGYIGTGYICCAGILVVGSVLKRVLTMRDDNLDEYNGGNRGNNRNGNMRNNNRNIN